MSKRIAGRWAGSSLLRLLLVTLVSALLAADGRVCAAAIKVQLLVIGNNRPFAAGDVSESAPALPTLRFADDDAVAFYQLMVEIAQDGYLLTVMDADTQSANPDVARVTRPPNREQLTLVLQALRRRMDENRARGDQNVLYFFFSGHGSMVEEEGPSLALLDGGISHRFLYEEILSKLPADYVHVLIDACHAEAVVRPRDSAAKQTPISTAEAATFLTGSTLARFPHVGTVLAASGDANAHEWDLLGHGVFTYELLSALRGAADVSRDGIIEYSEVFAFLRAANRGVEDSRARLTVVARPPEIDRHIPLLDLSRLPGQRTARIVGVPDWAGYVQVEDGAGRQLVTLRAEPGFTADLVLPAGATYIRSGRMESRLETRAGQVVPFGDLVFREPPARARGALEDAVSRGLFATEFGPGYYRGFVDQAPDFAPVVLGSAVYTRSGKQEAPALPGTEAMPGRRLLLGVGSARPVATGLDASRGLRVALHPRRPNGVVVAADLLRSTAANVAEWRATAAAGWLWSRALGPARGWIGAAAGGGAIVQTAPGTDTLLSGQVTAGALSGIGIDLARQFGIWGEAQVAAAGYRLDGRDTLTVAPSVFLGFYIGL